MDLILGLLLLGVLFFLVVRHAVLCYRENKKNDAP